MQTVVTGATGFVGQELCRLLRSEGHTFTVVGRDAARAHAMYPDAPFASWNDADALNRAVRDADCVFHLAGESVGGERWTPAYKEKIWASRTETTRRIVQANPRALVSASAVGFYGGQSDTVLTENSPAGNDFLARVCVAWEQAAMQAAPKATVAVVRIGIVLGKNGGPLQTLLDPPQVPFSPWKLGLGGPLGNGKQWMPWVHIADLARLFLWCATRSGAYNGVAPNPVTNADFSHAIGRALHRPSFVSVPAFALRALIGEFADYLLYSQRVVPERTTNDGFEFGYSDINAALSDILGNR